MAGALIVTAEIAPPDLAWLDRLRRAHYPPNRNQLPAHLRSSTPCHHLRKGRSGDLSGDLPLKHRRVRRSKV